MLPVQPLDWTARRSRGHLQQGIDDRVARDMHGSHHPGSLQIRGRLLSRGEMKLSNLRNQTPIGLLWEGVINVVGPQAGFHMANGDLVIEGR